MNPPQNPKTTPATTPAPLIPSPHQRSVGRGLGRGALNSLQKPFTTSPPLIPSPRQRSAGRGPGRGVLLLLCLLPFAFSLCPAQSVINFYLSQFTGITNDTTITLQSRNNPVIYNGQFYWWPPYGTNLVTTNGFATITLVPGQYTMSLAGIPQNWVLSVTNSATPLNAATLTTGTMIYNGINSLTGPAVTNDGHGNYYVNVLTNGSSGGGGNGSATNVNNATGTNVSLSGVFVGYAGGLTNMYGSSIVGSVPSALLANTASYATNAGYALWGTNAWYAAYATNAGTATNITGATGSGLNVGGLFSGSFAGSGSGLVGLTGANVNGAVASAQAATLATNAINATNIYGAGLVTMTNAALTVFTNSIAVSNSYNGSFSGGGAGLTNINLAGTIQSNLIESGFNTSLILTRIPSWRAKLAEEKLNQTNISVYFLGDSTTVGYGANPYNGYAVSNCLESNAVAFASQLIPNANHNAVISTHLVITNDASFYPPNIIDSQIFYPTNWSISKYLTLGGTLWQSLAGPTNPIIYAPSTPNNFIRVITFNFGGNGALAVYNGTNFLGNIQTGVPFSYVGPSNYVFQTTYGTNYYTLVPYATNTQTVYFVGAIAGVSSNSINLVNAGVEGSASVDWNQANTGYDDISFLKYLQPDLVVFNIGINDFNENIPEWAYESNIVQVVTNLQASGIPVVLETPHPFLCSGTNPITDIPKIMASIANQYGCGFLDLMTHGGSYALESGAGLDFDNYHPNVLGYMDNGNFLAGSGLFYVR